MISFIFIGIQEENNHKTTVKITKRQQSTITLTDNSPLFLNKNNWTHTSTDFETGSNQFQSIYLQCE